MRWINSIDQSINFVIQLVLITWSGKLWRSQRHFSLRALRNLGFGKSKFEGKIYEEMKYMTDKMDNGSGESTIKIKQLVGPSVSNVIMLMTTGQRYDFDHPIRQNMDRLFLTDRSTSVFFNFYSLFSHFTYTFRFLIGLIPEFIIPQMKEFINYLPDLLTRITHERLQVIDKMNDHELSEQGDCFIDSYLKHMKLLTTSNDENHVEERQFFTGNQLLLKTIFVLE